MKGQFQLNNFNIRFQAKPPTCNHPPKQSYLFKQGVLPPCCPIGQWRQGQLYLTTPQDRQNNRIAPANPLTTRPGGVRSRRAPGQSEARRSGRRVEEGRGLESFQDEPKRNTEKGKIVLCTRCSLCSYN